MDHDDDRDSRILRAALFVDFDNIFISFDNLDVEASKRFATQPARWVEWLESGAHAHDENVSGPEPRRILVRKCYLNPLMFGRYRGDFIRAAFQVVDCPPLTTRGKTSADIYMVMDILDALEHRTRFDEFIILSSDADFTPVLLRLRAHDRRTAILCTDLTAAAYKAACDYVVPHDLFFDEALGLEEVAAPTGLPSFTAGNGGSEAEGEDAVLVAEVARVVRERAVAEGGIAAKDLPGLFQRFPEFRNSHWFGHYSLKALAARIIELEPVLVFVGDPQGAWSLLPNEQPARAGEAAAPARRSTSELEPSAAPDDLQGFIRRIAGVTGTPALSPTDYAVLFRAIAEAVAEGKHSFNELAHVVRDRCQEQGSPVSRSAVTFVLGGFRYHGFELAGRTPEMLAGEWRRNLVSLCANAQVPLSRADEALFDRWLVAPLAPGRETPGEEPAEHADGSGAEPADLENGSDARDVEEDAQHAEEAASLEAAAGLDESRSSPPPTAVIDDPTAIRVAG